MAGLGGHKGQLPGRGGSGWNPQGWQELDWLTGWGWPPQRLGDTDGGPAGARVSSDGSKEIETETEGKGVVKRCVALLGSIQKLAWLLWGRWWVSLFSAKPSVLGLTTHCVPPPRPWGSPSKSRPPAREKWVRATPRVARSPSLIPVTLLSRERRGQYIDQACPGLVLPSH